VNPPTGHGGARKTQPYLRRPQGEKRDDSKGRSSALLIAISGAYCGDFFDELLLEGTSIFGLHHHFA
jgi:hypothetical protein